MQVSDIIPRRGRFNFSAILLLLALTISCISGGQEKFSEDIRINQTGFYPAAPKMAVVLSTQPTEFYIASPDLKEKYLSGKLSDVKQSAFSPRRTRIADFSAFKTPGQFVVVVPGLGYSHLFEVRPKVHEAVVKASIKAFYYQRFSIPLTEQYAGKWHRASGPLHHEILIHPSAATEKRPAGTIISSTRGWIDAGDYNKYIVNSGITTGTLLSAYADFPAYFDTLKLAIPESGDAVPDLIDEILWNVRWMLTMQDPDDGGVYHKCTNAKFDPMVMPDKATTPRYVVQKGTAAALNFSAVTAQASRVLRKFESRFPGLADSCLSAATYAWKWARKNPDVPYDQNRMNATFDPDVTTGAYGDRNFSDEFIWAAAELYVATGDDQYRNAVDFLSDAGMLVPSWSQVRLLGYYTLVRNEKQLPQAAQPVVAEMKKRILQFADNMISGVGVHPYHVVMGAAARDFIWGSNAVAANQGIVLVQAYRISHEKKYLENALCNLDYLLGRNATGYSFVTGHGDKTPMHPHHRPSEADGVVDPVPGLLAGGPNPGMQDKCTYPSSVPDEAYIDDVCSYASNEVAINWNAPLVYLSGAMEALQGK
jgi:endoglucanase